MENFPVLPITPRESLQCLPIFIAYDQSGPGHYDAVVQVENIQPIKESQDSSTKNLQENLVRCRCGQASRKKAKDITSCDQFHKRCKCFQGLKGCTNTCNCRGCGNPYGKIDDGEGKSSNISTGTRKRRSPGITTKFMTGKQFIAEKRLSNCEQMNITWGTHTFPTALWPHIIK